MLSVLDMRQAEGCQEELTLDPFLHAGSRLNF